MKIPQDNPTRMETNPPRISKLALVSLCVTVPWFAYAWLICFLVDTLGWVNEYNWYDGLYIVFGLVAILIGGIVCGHVAECRIKKSGGALRGKWLARAASVAGYVWLLVFVFYWGNA